MGETTILGHLSLLTMRINHSASIFFYFLPMLELRTNNRGKGCPANCLPILYDPLLIGHIEGTLSSKNSEQDLGKFLKGYMKKQSHFMLQHSYSQIEYTYIEYHHAGSLIFLPKPLKPSRFQTSTYSLQRMHSGWKRFNFPFINAHHNQF